MPDVYLSIASQPDTVIDAIARSMDARAAEPAMQKICAAYMGHLPKLGARVLEVGCGNGAVSSLIMKNLSPGVFVGVDPSEGLLEKARQRHGHHEGIRFSRGDALNTGEGDGSADVVIANTVYSHLPDPDGALAEAYRVLRPGGSLAVFDGDYATITVALHEDDPLQGAVRLIQRHLVHDPYVMRRMPAMVKRAGFADITTEAYGYVQTDRPDYLLTFIARGVDMAVSLGDCSPALAEALKAEAQRRTEDGTFYGAIVFASVIAKKPATA